MFANRLIPLNLAHHSVGKMGVEDFRNVAALQAKQHKLQTIFYFLHAHVLSFVYLYYNLRNNISLGLLQSCFQRYQNLCRNVDTALEYVYKLTSCGAPNIAYCNVNMGGGKILKGLQNRRIDERALFLG